MADKEATVYIVDVGRSMGQRRNGREQTDLEWAMTWIWDKITSVVATERKTLLQGIIALRTDGTRNDLSEEDSYHHISVVQELQQILLPQLKQLQHDLIPSRTDRGDAISALVLALGMIDETCKKLKYRRKIVLVTNADGGREMDDSDVGEISKKIVQDGVELTILGVDFDDEEYGFSEQDKSQQKKKNETVLKQLAEDCSGVYGTLAEAVGELGIPRIKETRPVPSYRGVLTLGNPQTYPETTVVIDVERYPRTMIRRPQTASSYVVAPTSSAPAGSASTDTVMDGTERQKDDQAQDEYAQVRNQVSYFVNDPEAPEGKLRVDRDDLARGYEYGRTAVHISDVDEGITKIETHIGLEIVGFIPWTSYERYMSMSNTHVVVASKANSKAIMALSSFIHALHELESYAIARLVTKDGKEPTMEVLAPSIEPEFECLLNVNLPFSEDVRSYKFPPLDKVVTVSGKELTKHRLLPTDAVIDAIDEYVDMMDLSEFKQNDEDESEEYLQLQDSFSPVLHYIDQAVRWRAVHPDETLPTPYEALTRYQHPPKQLLEEAKKSLGKLTTAAEVKKVPPKFVGRRKKETTKPLSGLDIDALLDSKKERKIDPNNPIPTLRQMLDTDVDPKVLENAAKQMGDIIEKRVKKSYGDSAYEQAIEEMTVLRDEMKSLEEPALWNDFITAMKAKLRDGQLGEGRIEFWWRVKRAKLGLLEGKIPGRAEVTPEEASEFMKMQWSF